MKTAAIIVVLVLSTWSLAQAESANVVSFSASQQGYLTTPASTDLMSITNAVTIETWIKPSAGGGEWALIAGKQLNPSDYNPWYSYRLLAASANAGEKGFPRRVEFNIAPTTAGGEVGVVSTTVVPNDVWTHVAGVYDGATVKIYINGVLEASMAQTGTLKESPYPLYLGHAPWTSYNNYNGEMDEFSLWNVAKTQEEIQYSMTHSFTGAETGLVTYYRFNEPTTSQTVDDSSQFNNIGTLHLGVNMIADASAPALSGPVASGAPVPEPLTLAAIGTGLVGLGAYIRRRRAV
jgi:hypothetical protein